MFPVNPDDLLRVSANPYQDAVEVKVLKIEGSKRGERTFTLNNNPSANPDATNTLVLTEQELYDWLVNAGDERVDKTQVPVAVTAAPTLVEPPPPPAAPHIPAAPRVPSVPPNTPPPPNAPTVPTSPNRGFLAQTRSRAESYLSKANAAINAVATPPQNPNALTYDQRKATESYKAQLDIQLSEYFKNPDLKNIVKRNLKNTKRDWLPEMIASMHLDPITEPEVQRPVREYILKYIADNHPDLLPKTPNPPQTP